MIPTEPQINYSKYYLHNNVPPGTLNADGTATVSPQHDEERANLAKEILQQRLGQKKDGDAAGKISGATAEDIKDRLAKSLAGAAGNSGEVNDGGED